MSNPLAMAPFSNGALSAPESASVGELGSGWRCVKSEDYGQTYIFGAPRRAPRVCCSRAAASRALGRVRVSHPRADAVPASPRARAEPALPANTPTPGDALPTPLAAVRPRPVPVPGARSG